VRKSFIIMLMAPLLIILFSAIVGYFSASSALKGDKGIVGYVDPSGALVHAIPAAADADNTFQQYPDRASADEALRSQHIVAYFSLAANFTSTGQADFYYWQFKPGKQVQAAFNQFVKTALIDGTDSAVAQRLLSGSHYLLSTPDGSRTFSDNDVFAIILPLVVSGMFMIALFSGASYLLQAVVDEKENRTMEIIITSVTPMQLMSGKIIGLAAVALTQVGVWLAAGMAAVQLLKTKLDFMQNVHVDPIFIVMAIAFSILQYLLYGAFMAAIGSVVLDAKQGQTWSSPIIISGMLPMFFFGVILFDPNGTLAVILSLFPLTAPLAMILRYNMTNVPLWQIAVAFILLVLSVIGAMWLAARVFRLGMLRYGQTISLAEIASHIRI
jgi:ABC-2 type transport system permease protein